MRILIATNHLHQFAGTEQWTRTMVQAFQQLGHEVDCFAYERGPAAEDMPMVDRPALEYDLSLLNHNTIQRLAHQIGGPKIVTVHGPGHPMEQPLPGFDMYVGISPEICSILRGWRWPTALIRNPIDTKKYHMGRPITDPPRVLGLCKGTEALGRLERLCDKLGYSFFFAHYLERPVLDVHLMMQNTDIVVTYGRGAYEALACGRHVLVYDHRYDDGKRVHYGEGWLTPTTMEAIAWYNCSGRRLRCEWTKERLEYALTDEYKALPDHGWGPRWIAQHHDAQRVAQQYLALLTHIQGRDDERSQTKSHDPDPQEAGDDRRTRESALAGSVD